MKSLLKLSFTALYLTVPAGALFAQGPNEYTTRANPPGPIFWIIYCAVLLFILIAMWKVFTKAGEPG